MACGQCYLPYLNIIHDITGAVLAPAGGGCGGRQGGDDGAVPEVGVLGVHVLHTQPGGLPQLVAPPQVALAPEVEGLVLVVSSPADQLRHVSEADGGGGAAGGDAAQGLVGGTGGGGAWRGVGRGAGVLHAGQSVVTRPQARVGMARGQDSQRVVDHFMTRTIESIVSSRHEVVELGGR